MVIVARLFAVRVVVAVVLFAPGNTIMAVPAG
jgi:hypothetical protein